MDEEVDRVSVSKKETDDILSDTEIRQFFFQKYFSSNPENDVEKTITAEELLKIIKSYYDKCHKLEKIIIDGSTTVQHARKELQWYRVLRSNFTLEDLTFVAETFMLEYEMSAKDENRSFFNREDIKEMSQKKKKLDEKKKVSEDVKSEKPASASNSESGSQDNALPREPEECVESLLALYHLADAIERNILQNWREYKTFDEIDAKDTRGKGNERTSEEKKLEAVSSSEKVASQTTLSGKISPDRLEFIRTFKVMIRATLILFKRMNPEWVQQAEEVIKKSSPLIIKRKLVFQGKSISIESSSTEDPIPALSSVASPSSAFEVSPSKPEISEQLSKETMEVDP